MNKLLIGVGCGIGICATMKATTFAAESKLEAKARQVLDGFLSKASQPAIEPKNETITGVARGLVITWMKSKTEDFKPKDITLSKPVIDLPKEEQDKGLRSFVEVKLKDEKSLSQDDVATALVRTVTAGSIGIGTIAGFLSCSPLIVGGVIGAGLGVGLYFRKNLMGSSSESTKK